MFGLHTEELLTKIASLQEENAHLCRTIIHLFKDDSSLKEQYEALMHQNEDLSEQQSDDQQEIRELKEAIHNLVDEKAELQEQHQDDQRHIRDEASNVSMLRNEINDLKFELGKFREYVNLPFVMSVIERMPSLEAELKEHADKGQQIKGIKAIRAATNCDLKVGKAAWEQFVETHRNDYVAAAEAPVSESTEPDATELQSIKLYFTAESRLDPITAFLNQGEVHQACVTIRNWIGCSMSSAKTYIQEVFADHPAIVKESEVQIAAFFATNENHRDVLNSFIDAGDRESACYYIHDVLGTELLTAQRFLDPLFDIQAIESQSDDDLIAEASSYDDDLQHLREFAAKGTIHSLLERVNNCLNQVSDHLAVQVIIEQTGYNIPAIVQFINEHFRNHPMIIRLGPLDPADYID